MTDKKDRASRKDCSSNNDTHLEPLAQSAVESQGLDND
jgi:hypothetical protein